MSAFCGDYYTVDGTEVRDYIRGVRRPGDIAECYAASSLAKTFLGWLVEFDLALMCDPILAIE
ncbi:hypothetical protein [Marinomonas shanghaiensis]|uniref:hypothetical protein n=1 Tax=Marinomonas shanghaiensis TaxID=2202418 RepID=UPI003A952DCA